MYYPNLSPLRSFNWLTYRILSDYHVKLHRLSDGLYGLDVETEEGGGKGEDEDDTQSERRERLMAEIKPLYKEYRKAEKKNTFEIPFPSGGNGIGK